MKFTFNPFYWPKKKKIFIHWKVDADFDQILQSQRFIFGTECTDKWLLEANIKSNSSLWVSLDECNPFFCMQNYKAHPLSHVWCIWNVSMSVKWTPTLNNSQGSSQMCPSSPSVSTRSSWKQPRCWVQQGKVRDGESGTQEKSVAHRLKVGDDNSDKRFKFVGNTIYHLFNAVFFA